MTVAELIEKLKTMPQDLTVWVSDGGYIEGASKLREVCVRDAWDSGLDGDEVNDEYFINDDLSSVDGYVSHEDGVWSKNILLIKTSWD